MAVVPLQSNIVALRIERGRTVTCISFIKVSILIMRRGIVY